MNPTKIIVVVFTTILSVYSTASAQITNPVRNVQIRTIDLLNQTVEVHNFGTTNQPLDGWRFCTHDESVERRYSSASALNGMSLAAGESMFVMYNNDADPAAANEFNISSLGNFALPLDAEGAYAIQFYINSSFSSGPSIADHLQFSTDGLDDNRADARSGTAEGAVWSDQNAWISVSDLTETISLAAGAESNEVHSPADYVVTDEVVTNITNAFRNVQIRTIDLANQTIEISNFGTTDQPLDGWRFCTHDESVERRYTSSSGFNGVTLAAGESLFLMYNNDASAANEFNISSLGSFATPLDAQGAYAIQFYINSSFGSGASIADFVQFSEDGLDNDRADARSSIAQGIVWSDQSAWISVGDLTETISLAAGAEINEIQGPTDYVVTDQPAGLIGDFDNDGDVDVDDIDAYTGNISLAATGDLTELDLNGDQVITTDDLNLLVTQHVQIAAGIVGTFLGDTNLDGTVDVLGDAFALVGNLGSVGGVSWADGDLNADDQVDVLGDAFALVGNLGNSVIE